MEKKNTEKIEVTKIQAKQAIWIAVITAISSIAGTMLATGALKEKIPVSPAFQAPTISSQVFWIDRNKKSKEKCFQQITFHISSRGGKLTGHDEDWMDFELHGLGISLMFRPSQGELLDGCIMVAGNDHEKVNDTMLRLSGIILD